MVVLPILEFELKEDHIVSKSRKKEDFSFEDLFLKQDVNLFFLQITVEFYLKNAMSFVALMYSLTIGIKSGG